MSIALHIGDCRAVLPSLPDASVHCVVTSPPYWGLRDYGHADQLGLEPDFTAYVANMVAVFREVRRVLRDDGTLWLNLGDSYASSGISGKQSTTANLSRHGANGHNPKMAEQIFGRAPTCVGLKPKDLCGIPWRVAFALQTDGWVLRQEIIWAKPNPMPESVTDRCTKSHEQLFLFAKAKWVGAKPTRFAHISDEDARWLALCIDTEGCIVVKRVRQLDGGADTFGPQVTFGGTSRDLVERFRLLVGHGNIATRSGKNAPMYYWQIGNNLARDFLHRIYPHLIVKQRQARIGIYVDDLVYYRGGKMLARKQRTAAENSQLLSLWARNKQCNQFGNPDLSDIPESQFGRWADCERYYYDADAIREPQSDPERGTAERTEAYGGSRGTGFENEKFVTRWKHDETARSYNPLGRNKRSVWEVTTQPFSEAHFATFPPALIEPCIKAGCPIGGTVLDPFGGAGTTGLVADRLQRNAVLIELNPAYAAMSERRIVDDAPLFVEMAT